MKIGDKAKESPDVYLIRDAQYSAYRLVSDDLAPADEVTDEGEFPQYGDFAICDLPDGDGGFAGKIYVEVPQDLAAGMVELGIEPGDEFRIGEATKVDGEWQVTVEPGAEKS